MNPKKLAGSYEKEMGNRRVIIIVAIILIIFIVAGLVLYLRKPKSNKSVKGQNLISSISSFENKYNGSIVGFNTSLITDPWIKTTGPSNEFNLSRSSCSSKLKSASGVKALVNSGATLNSAINLQLEELNKLSLDNSLVVGNTSSFKINSNKGMVEFLVKEAEYNLSQGNVRKVKIFEQWIGDYQMVIIQDCSAAQFDEYNDGLDKFIKDLRIEIN